jgi:dipeptidyl aminopeptidase/acylaminoacyl peptidase
VYQSEVGLWALPFSLETLAATGEPFPIKENASYPSVAGDGTLLYREEEPVLQQLVWRDRGGKKVGVIGRPQRVIRHPALSPDGSRVAVRALENENYDIWIHDVAQPLKIRLSFHPANEQRPAWTSSGDKIAFSSDRNGNHDIFIKSADASGEAELLMATPVAEFDTDWSMDGQYVVGDDMDGDIWYVRAKEGATGYQKETFHGTQFREIAPKLSPNGIFLAYESDESGQQEVYVRPFPEGNGKWPVSTRGGRSARWRQDGSELFYLEGDSLMAVSVATSPTFSKGRATRLFDLLDTAGVDHPGHTYDVSADGQRFVFVESLEESPPPLIRVVQNWYEEFRDREQD